MNKPTWCEKILLQEDLNFLLTNRVPRIALTRFMGWFSRIQSPWLTRLSIAIWRLFTPLDLSEARQQRFDSLHACFTRELKPGARPFEPQPDVICSPCDAIVGACGTVQDDSAAPTERQASAAFWAMRVTSSRSLPASAAAPAILKA